MKDNPRDNLKQDLLDQLERNGAVGSYYEDMVEDWIRFWDMKKGLLDDISERGEKVTKYDSRGQKQIMNNESIEQAIKTSVQMQKILDFLGLKPPAEQGGGDPGSLEM